MRHERALRQDKLLFPTLSLVRLVVLVYEAVSAQRDRLARTGAHYLWAAITEAVEQRPAARSDGVDVSALIAKLRALPLATNLAIIDAVEQSQLMPELPRDQALRTVGLLRGRV